MQCLAHRLGSSSRAAQQCAAPIHAAPVPASQLRAATGVDQPAVACSSFSVAPGSKLSWTAGSSLGAQLSSRLGSGRTGVMAGAGAGSTGSTELLVVGPGVLGGYAGKLWLESHPGAAVTGLTNTSNNHDRLVKLGLQPCLKSDLPAGKKFTHVLFSAPPSGSKDYAAEVSAALRAWDSTAPGASFVFTSSMGVCPVDDGSTVREDCPVAAMGASASTDRLLQAEKLVLEAGGNVVRLVGLYHATRGAHTYFLKIKDVPRPSDYIVNLLHYEDAAHLATSVLAGAGSGPFKGQIFLGCDNNPVTFKDMMAACMRSPLFAGQAPVNWTVPDQGPGKSKRADNSATRQQLGGWAPRYASFVSFMDDNGGKDFYNTSGIF